MPLPIELQSLLAQDRKHHMEDRSVRGELTFHPRFDKYLISIMTQIVAMGTI
jgi:hypothetical protein